MIDLKDFNECPIREYVRIIQLKDKPAETLTDQELWVLYTKALDDTTSEIVKELKLQDRATAYVSKYELELANRGIFTAAQTLLFEGEN